MWKRNALKRKFYQTDVKETVWSLCVVNLFMHHFDQLCTSRAGNPRAFWKSLRLLMHTRKHRSEDFIVLKEDDRIIRDQSEVAETFNKYFINITKDSIIHDHSTFSDQIHLKRIHGVNNEAANAFSFHLTNHHVVKTILEDIKTNKAQAYDFFSTTG